MKEHDWIDGVRTRLCDAELAPPVDGWERLEGQLNKRRGLLLGWPWLVGATVAAMVVLACGMAWWFASTDAMSDEPALVAERQETSDAVPSPIVEESVTLTAPNVPVQRATPQTLLEESAPTEPSVICEELVADEEESMSVKEDKFMDEKVVDAADEQATQTTTKKTTTSALSHRGLLAAANEQRAEEPIRNRGWRLGVMGSGGRAISTSGAMRNQLNQNFDAAPGPGILGDNNSDSLRIPLVPKQQIVDNKYVTHHQPWSLGLTVSRDLGRGFSFETGLVYTLLRSEMRYMTYSTMQQMHLLGVPLRIDKEIFGAGRFSLYAGLGGMVEIPVHSSFDGRRVAERAVQCSLTATLGAEYRIGRLTALYAEPGLAWYMTETHLETIRTDHPLTLSLCLGLRFRLGMKE